jgi:hypothetical protein
MIEWLKKRIIKEVYTMNKLNKLRTKILTIKNIMLDYLLLLYVY